MYHQFNIQQFYVLPTQRIYVFCVDLRTNGDYFPIQHKLTGFCNGHADLFARYYSENYRCASLDRSFALQEVEDAGISRRHMKVVRLSALRTSRHYPTGDTPGNHFCQRLSRPQGHSAAGRIK